MKPSKAWWNTFTLLHFYRNLCQKCLSTCT